MNKQVYAAKIGLSKEEMLNLSDSYVDGYSPRTVRETHADTLTYMESKIDKILARLEQIEQVMQIDYCETNTKKKEDMFDRWLK